MDASGVFLLFLVLFCVLQGVLIARVRGLSNEISILKSALSCSVSPTTKSVIDSGTASALSPEAVAALVAAMGGVNDGE